MNPLLALQLAQNRAVQLNGRLAAPTGRLGVVKRKSALTDSQLSRASLTDRQERW